jgi:hypothetical protein
MGLIISQRIISTTELRADF